MSDKLDLFKIRPNVSTNMLTRGLRIAYLVSAEFQPYVVNIIWSPWEVTDCSKRDPL